MKFKPKRGNKIAALLQTVKAKPEKIHKEGSLCHKVGTKQR